jgi:uridine kinase
LRYRRRLVDLATDAAVEEWGTARPDSILVVDGSFLQRPELRAGWDEVVYVDVTFDTALERGLTRDAADLGGTDAAREAFEKRYHAAGHRYLNDVDPREQASIVIDNNDLRRPVLRRLGRG